MAMNLLPLKTNILSILMVFLTITNAGAQIEWDGGGANTNWQTAANWNPDGVPTGTDDITIGDGFSITSTADIEHQGSITIGTVPGSTTILNMGGRKIKIGTDENTAILINYGTITNMSNLEVKGDGPVGGGPYLENYGTINCVDLKPGNNVGGGLVSNFSSGEIYVSGNSHADGSIFNDGFIEVLGEFLVHGAVVTGTGTIEAGTIEIKPNPEAGAAGAGVSGSIAGVSFSAPGGCSTNGDGSENTDFLFNVNNVDYTYQELVLLIEDGDPAVSNFDLDPSVFSCGENGDSVLPITLLNFNYLVDNLGVLLLWSTATEINNERFEVEKSTDGVSFIVIGTVLGNGSTNHTNKYEFLDENTNSGISYYRLKQIDFDGAFEYYNLISVINDQNNEVSIFPNPVNEHTKIHLSLHPDTILNMRVSSMTGSDILSYSGYINDINNQLGYLIPNLDKGIYILTIENALGVTRIKLLK
jgi:hypothetical protein